MHVSSFHPETNPPEVQRSGSLPRAEDWDPGFRWLLAGKRATAGPSVSRSADVRPVVQEGCNQGAGPTPQSPGGSRRCWDRDKTPPAPPGGSVRWRPKGGRKLAENKMMFAPLRVNIPPSCLLWVGRLCSLRRIGWERVWVRAPHSNALGSLHRQRGSFMISTISRRELDPR